MDERDWLLCTFRPDRHLEYLRGRASERKLRLFACACVRRLWQHLRTEQAQQAVVILERFLEGEASRAAFDDARAAHRKSCPAEAYKTMAEQEAYNALTYTLDWEWNSPEKTVQAVVTVYAWEERERTGDFETSVPDQLPLEGPRLCGVLLDLVGNPFRPLALAPGARTPTVLELAREAYEEREIASGILRSDRLEVLADALEEAGCTEAALLQHLHSGWAHYRGCHAVDLILGRS